MKQKEIYIDPSLNLESQKMIEMYFEVKTVRGIEGFVYSEEEFLKKFKNGYPFNDLRSAKYYAIYKDRCRNCAQDYEIIINSRNQFYEHLNSDIAICNGCNIIQSVLETMLGNKFDEFET